MVWRSYEQVLADSGIGMAAASQGASAAATTTGASFFERASFTMPLRS